MTTYLSCSTARHHILRVASELFYQKGIRAVGVDTIVERSGVGKATLYRHFQTKDDLIVAYLEEKNRRFWIRFDEVIATHKDKPMEQLLALFEVVAQILTEPWFRGCPFLNIRVEIANVDHPAYQSILKHEREVQKKLSHLLTQVGAPEPEQMAFQILLLLNGAMTSAPLFDAASVALQFKTMATHLVTSQIEPA